MNDNHIKFLVVGRPNDQTILGGEAPDSIKKTVKQEYTESAQELIDVLGQSSPYQDLRDDTETIYGSWYTYCDHNILSYSVLTSPSYKKNIAYDLLKKFSRELYEEYPDLNTSHSTVHSLDIKDLVERL